MKSLQVKPLSLEGFKKFGTYSLILEPDTPHLGGVTDPVCFYRDIMQIRADGHVSVSTGVCLPVEKKVEIMEYHSHTAEAFMMLDGDVVMAFAPATADDRVPVDEIEAFLIPKGVMVYISAGVWHYAQMPVGDRPVTSIVLLPERTYANDCFKVTLLPEEQLLVV